jgi:transcriptional regulator with XRE-family HTH domain
MSIAHPDKLSEFYQFVDAHSNLTQRQIAAHFDISQTTVSRWLAARASAPVNGTAPREPAKTPTALQRIEIVGTPVSAHDTADLKAQIDVLAAHVKDLQVHRLEIDAWIATLQAQSRDTAQPRAEMRSAELRSLAQPSADVAHLWDDPDDAKAVPFNCSLPRGLKRLLDAEAKRTGLPASRLVQRLLMAALTREEGRNDA